MNQQSFKPPFGAPPGERSNVGHSSDDMSDRGRFSPDRSSTRPPSDGLGGARLGNDAMPGNTGSPAAGLADLPRQTGTDALADQANEAADAAIDAALSAGGALEAATAEIAEVAKEAARATLRAV